MSQVKTTGDLFYRLGALLYDNPRAVDYPVIIEQWAIVGGDYKVSVESIGVGDHKGEPAVVISAVQ